MTRSLRIPLAAISAAVAILAGVASALGVVARGDGSFVTVTSVRGVTYDMAASGVYQFNAQRVVAEGVGWDVFTLLVAVPALLVGAALVARGSSRGRLFAAGMLGYMLYQYLEYAVTWAFGPLFLLFVLIYGASFVAILGLGYAIATDREPLRFGTGFPRRAWPLLSVAMGALLTLMWLARINAGLAGDYAGAALYGETTMVVQALDLGLMVPISLLIAVLAWRGHPLGGPLSAVWVVTFVTMTAAIGSMLLSAGAVEGRYEIVPISIFGAAAAAGLVLAVRMYRSLERPAVAVGALPSQRHAPVPA